MLNEIKGKAKKPENEKRKNKKVRKC